MAFTRGGAAVQPGILLPVGWAERLSQLQPPKQAWGMDRQFVPLVENALLRQLLLYWQSAPRIEDNRSPYAWDSSDFLEPLLERLLMVVRQLFFRQQLRAKRSMFGEELQSARQAFRYASTRSCRLRTPRALMAAA